MVPPASHKVSRASWYSGCRSDSSPCSLRDSHPLRCRFPTASRLAHCRVVGPTTPGDPKIAWFGLVPVRSPLLWESRLISFRRATEMFQFTRCPPPRLCVQQGVSRHHSGWVAPFGFSGLIACMQLPLNVSPVSASFFGLMRQGIHLVLCVACSLLAGMRLLPCQRVNVLRSSASILVWSTTKLKKNDDSVVQVQGVVSGTSRVEIKKAVLSRSRVHSRGGCLIHPGWSFCHPTGSCSTWK